MSGIRAGSSTHTRDAAAQSSRDTDASRLHAVERYRALETPADRVSDRIAGLAGRFFNTPMAAVAIVDHDRIWFLASRGFDETARQLARDDGLFASVTETDTPYVVQDAFVDPRTAGSRFVHEHQIRFCAAAPIVTFDGYRLGAVAVLDTEARSVSAEQLATLQDLAGVVMEQLELRLSSLNAVRAERRLRGAAEHARRDRDNAKLDRDEARTDRDEARIHRDEAMLDRNIAVRERDLTEQYAMVLQRTLLPPSLPKIDGLTLASRYHPASARQVGGDFYDVFALGGDRWAFFIGDVEGHGAEAAAVTSLIRYTLRSAALHYRDPVDGLAELNSVLLREAVPRRFCTVLFGTLEPHDDGEGFQVTVATGGHPPALLLDPSRATVQEVRSEGGMLVGMLAEATFEACSVHLRAGQTLLFYTDGLIEARRALTPFDEASLAAFALNHATAGPRGVIDQITTLIPMLRPDDDIALLAFGALD
jgi:phosphoserine phosphatase RsbU/P